MRNNKLNIEIFDLTPPGDEFNYLRPEGTVTLGIKRKYQVPIINIIFDGWYENSVCLWAKHNAQRKHFSLLQRTLP